MKKKLVSLLLISMLSLSIVACGSEEVEQKSASETTEDSESEVSGESEEESETAEVVEENGMRKEPVATNKELNITGETGPMKYTIEGIQVSKLTATTDEAAELLGIEKDKEVALVAVNASAENTSQDTVSFYLGQATLTSNTKEQVESDMFLSEYIEGEFIGNVINSGNMIYILPNSNADDITNISLHIDAPCNADFETIGDDVTVDITIG